MVGAPGTGKSHLARALAARLGGTLIQTDAIRKELFRTPRYSPGELSRVYAVAHRRIDESLAAGRIVVFDATNLRESGRRVLYRIAGSHGSPVLAVGVYAPESVIRDRLERRHRLRPEDDLSDADWAVFRRMSARAEPIKREHLIVNSCASPERALRLIASAVERATRSTHAAPGGH